MTYKSAYDIAEAFGYLTKKEVDGIKEIVRKLPDNPTAVNIGVGAGTSSIAIAEERADLYLISVDISEGGPFGGLENERNALETRELDITYRHSQILMDSKEYKGGSKGQFHLMFIDGDHSYEGCKGDIEAWTPWLSEGGYVLIHDYGSNNWPAVKEATDECLGEWLKVLHYDTLIAFQKPKAPKKNSEEGINERDR